MFSTVKFDFTKNQMIPAGSKQTVSVKCKACVTEQTHDISYESYSVGLFCDAGYEMYFQMLSVEFEPRQVSGVRQMFSSRARVNMDG